MSLTILNDVHLGARRQGGTTPQTQQKLRDYLQDRLSEFLDVHRGENLVIAGDLFDAFEVDSRDVLACYNAFAGFVSSGGMLTLVAGNHDWAPRGDKLSSFHFLTALLTSAYSIEVIDKGLSEVASGIWAIPHMPNQDLFDIELDKALRLNPPDISALTNPLTHLILHANYDNKFTVNSDHSLNVSREKAMAFADAGITLIFAHEHQAKSDLDGKVRVLGNQWPSSIADCLNNEVKYCHALENGELIKSSTWSRADIGGYTEMDWRNLDPDDETGNGFIRVVGEAAASEAEAVIEAISKYRAKSSAYVVGNAVKVAGMAEMNAMGEVSAESIKSFDVMSALLSELSEKEQEVVKGLV